MQFIITGIVGYLLVILRDVPMSILVLLKTNFSSSITTASKNKDAYSKLNEYIISLNKKSIINNIENEEQYRDGVNQKITSINYGKFLLKIDKLTWGIVSKELKDNGFEVSSVLTVTLFGLRREQNTLKIKDILNVEDIDYLRVFCSVSEYDSGILVPKKSFNDIYIDNKKEIISKIDKWKNNKMIYKNKGIIYKLGILLYGPPGTGKSSSARAIASYLNYNIYVINLKSFEHTRELLNKLLSIQEKSVVLFEDIDCVISNREDSKNNLEILGVAMNFIDGVYSPNDCIIIATTNYIDRLDSGLIRDGRFDIKMEINNINIGLAEDMCLDYGVDINDLNIDHDNINPSKLQNLLINRINN